MPRWMKTMSKRAAAANLREPAGQDDPVPVERGQRYAGPGCRAVQQPVEAVTGGWKTRPVMPLSAR